MFLIIIRDKSLKSELVIYNSVVFNIENGIIIIDKNMISNIKSATYEN